MRQLLKDQTATVDRAHRAEQALTRNGLDSELDAPPSEAPRSIDIKGTEQPAIAAR